MIFNGFQRRSNSSTAWHCFTLILAVVSGRVFAGEQGDILRSQDTTEALNFKFSAADEQLLDAVEKGCFNYLWNEIGRPSQIVQDRRTNVLASSAGIGFQLSSLPIAVERGWITRAAGQERALAVLRSILSRSDNNHDGIYLHFLDADTGGQPWGKVVDQASTVDHALLLAGALPAATYFGGDVAALVDKLAADSNWRSYDNSAKGFICFGWNPQDGRDMNGPGHHSGWDWHFASDEERIVYFVAAGAPRDDYAVPPEDYYRLEQNIGRHREMPPFVMSWNGSLFTYFFSHIWIDYRRFEADDPAAVGLKGRKVDWVENSRRAVLAHRARCIEASGDFSTLGPNRWGLSPCTGFDAEGDSAYLVPEIRPNVSTNENLCRGTIAPYAAGSAIMFAPEESIAALRAFRELKSDRGEPLAWREPEQGGYGLADSFNCDEQLASFDQVSIDAGPMLLAIENVRTGLIWKLFMDHPVARRAVDKLGFKLRK